MYKLIIYLIIIILFTFHSAMSALYISPMGSDDNNGTMENPIASFDQLFEQLDNGDSIILMEGTYQKKFTFDESVTADSGITIIADEKAIFGAFQLNVTGMNEGIFFINGKKDIIIDGIRINNVSGYGIEVKNCKGVTVKSCDLYNTFSSGILIWNCSDVLVSDNMLKECCNSGAPNAVIPQDYNKNVGIQECISIANCTTFIVEDNFVSKSFSAEQGAEGIDIKCASSEGIVRNNVVDSIASVGIYVDGFNSNLDKVIIEGNYVFNCRDGVIVASEQGGIVRDVTIQNNLIEGSEASGIGIRGNGWGGSDINYIYDITIVHNTVVNGSGVWSEGAILDVKEEMSDSIFLFNNLLVNNSGSQLAVSNTTIPILGTKIKYGNNLCSGGAIITDGPFDNILTGNVIFESDFHLSEGSSGIGMGDPQWVTEFDKDGLKRNLTTPTVGCFTFTNSSINSFKKNNYGDVKLTCRGSNFLLKLPEAVNGTIKLEIVSFSGRVLRSWSMEMENELEVQGSTKGLAIQPYILRFGIKNTWRNIYIW